MGTLYRSYMDIITSRSDTKSLGSSLKDLSGHQHKPSRHANTLMLSESLVRTYSRDVQTPKSDMSQKTHTDLRLVAYNLIYFYIEFVNIKNLTNLTQSQSKSSILLSRYEREDFSLLFVEVGHLLMRLSSISCSYSKGRGMAFFPSLLLLFSLSILHIFHGSAAPPAPPPTTFIFAPYPSQFVWFQPLLRPLIEIFGYGFLKTRSIHFKKVYPLT